ncbi:MAG: hypothetical protein ABI610_14100, partial [Acidobacteriota bacterium]
MELPPSPPTPREDVVDMYFGDRVADPYRWLEDAASPRVIAWTEDQNARTRAVLDALPQRKAFASRFRELLAVGLLGTPRPVGGRIFYMRREGSQAQGVLHVRDGVAGQDRALVDPNELDRSGLTTIDWYYPSPDARLVAVGLSRGGTEMSTLHVRDVASGADLGIAIPHTQRSQVAWAHEGFYYVVHPAPGTVPSGDEHYHRRVRYHDLAEAPRERGGRGPRAPKARRSQCSEQGLSEEGLRPTERPGRASPDRGEQDPVVFGQGRAKEDIVGVQTSTDGRWVLFSSYRGWVTNDLYLLDREHPERGLAVVVEGEDG